jgi:hypothetical protein
MRSLVVLLSKEVLLLATVSFVKSNCKENIHADFRFSS